MRLRYRHAEGSHGRDEWTAFSHIGREFDGQVVTDAEYRCNEAAYESVMLAFLREAGCLALAAQGVESAGGSAHASAEGDRLSLDYLNDVIRCVLRANFRFRLQATTVSFTLVGITTCTSARSRSASRPGVLAPSGGLFVEPCVSPYHPEPDQQDQAAAGPMSGQAQT